MFDDRRAKGVDRRKRRDPTGIPPTGCRRAGDRRDLLRQYEPLPWWLRTNYVEELQPPVLDQDPAINKRRHGVPRPGVKLWDTHKHKQP